MVSASFNQPLRDRRLPQLVLEVREAAAEHREAARAATEAIVARRIARYDAELEAFTKLLLIPLDTADVDLQSDTKWAAILPLAGRSLSLGRALVALVRAGYCVEIYPLARSIHETNQMLTVFGHPDGAALALQWLGGKPPKPITVAKAVRRIYASGARPSGGIETDAPAVDALQAALYRKLSGVGHNGRGSLSHSISHSALEITVGPNPDWGMRAYYTQWAGTIVWEICHSTSMVIAAGMGRDFYDDVLEPRLHEFIAFEEAESLPEEHLRAYPIELEVDE